MVTSEVMQIFEHTYQTTHDWLKELQDQAGLQDEGQAYSAMRAVLHALRDRLTVDEAAHLGAQLPMLVRGFYYEGYKPAAMPHNYRTKDEFLDAVASVYRTPPNMDIEQATRGVFALLTNRIRNGEIEDVRQMMPAELQELWP